MFSGSRTNRSVAKPINAVDTTSEDNMANNPKDTLALLKLWLFCTANFDVLNEVTTPGYDYTAIAGATGVSVNTAQTLLANAVQNNTPAAKGTTPLEKTATVFGKFAQAGGYVPEGGKVCGTAAEIIAALNS
jgi:hypothetical protein